MAGDGYVRCSDGFARCGGVLVKCWKTVMMPLVLLVALSAILPAVQSRTQGPSLDFSAHKIVRPKIYHGRSKREISSTKENDSDHADVLSVAFEINGVDQVLDLRLNTDLIPEGYRERRHHNGILRTHIPSKVELCHYHGGIREVPGSWAAISTCHGLKGVIFDGENLHHIEPEEETLDSIHYLYQHSDHVHNNTCGYDGTPHHIADEFVASKGHGRASRHKRATEAIRGPHNANRQSRYVELVIVVDKKEYVALGESLPKVHQHCKDIANIINALYMPLNIFVALVGVEVWTDTDEILLSQKGEKTLENFLKYRRERLVQEIPNDNAQLLTRIQFEDGVVGKALKGPICTYEYSGGVSVDHSNAVGLVAATMAHEIGHNFGMEHDSSECECPDDKCIMAPSSGSSGPVHWSSCSLEYLALAFEHGMDYCLRNKPKKLFDSPICGNGFVEPGEQCDCGLSRNCDNPCCNADTCMLHANASCATGSCCDLVTCKPKNAGTECRSAEHECDLPEYCTGQSEYCPTDIFKMDGESCHMGKAFCYQGSCRTHNDQCKLLWGPTGSSSDAQCYNMNNKGSENGNCGYNRVDKSYFKCNDENILCGMLHCKHLNERLEFGMESVAILSHSFINSAGKIIPCRTAIVDLGLNQVDPGLAPDGAKCAPGKMCINQKCMPVANLRASLSAGKACSNNCSGNGVCNSLGHCHCNPGFQPPDCVQPGVGGSEDSGPAEDPNARSEYIMALYIIFLGIVPVIALVSIGMWYMKNNGGGRQWKKGAISTISRGHDTLSVKTIDRSNPMPRSIDTIDRNLSQDPACASLLPKSDCDERYNNNFFGQFKGFSISPLQNAMKIPSKPAPAPPVVPAATVAIKTNLKPAQRNNTLRSALSGGTPIDEGEACFKVPTLPPPNVGSTARPLISSPVLAATTCTSVELIPSMMPTRPAPGIPANETFILEKPPRPNSTPLANSVLQEPEKKTPLTEKSTNTLNRIVSMLSNPISGIVRSNSTSFREEKYTNSLPRNQHQKANKVVDKELLRNLEISHPIPQKQIEIPTPTISVTPSIMEEEKRNVVMRAQSMRDSKVTSRPAIHTFGSMRQPNPTKRPTSIPASARPTSPPPGPPTKTSPISKPDSSLKIPGLPGYQNPQTKPSTEDAYDDCMNLVTDSSLGKISEESSNHDNIYAVIEESLPEKNRFRFEKKKNVVQNTINEYKTPKSIDAAAEAKKKLDSAGLLSEIVSEISNRNFDSIYSTSTIVNDKQGANKLPESPKISSNTYANSIHYKTPGSIYSNSAKFNSDSSTTSSGYLNPSAINTPEKKELKNDTANKQTLISKKNETCKEPEVKPAETPTTPTVQGSTPSKIEKKDTKSTDKSRTTTPKPLLNRTKTPPNIVKTQKSSKPENAKSSRQNSDSSLKSVKAAKDNKAEGVSQKNLCSPTKESATNKINSPDLVASCSNSNVTKSPDVLNSNTKVGTNKMGQKVSTLPKTKVTTPPKPSNLISKTANFAEKKSPTDVVKPMTVKEIIGQKEKNESSAKTVVPKTIDSKSTVVSLQQKFEPDKKTISSRTVPNFKKPPVNSVVKK